MALFEELGLRTGISNPEHEAILNIYFTAALIRKKADRFFRQFGISDVQFNVLNLLKYQAGEDGGLSQADLSRMLLVNRANITSLIDRMERDELVLRENDPEDRRTNIIRLTKKGRTLLEKIEEPYLEEIRKIMKPLSRKEMKILNGHMENIRKQVL